jgi:transposase
MGIAFLFWMLYLISPHPFREGEKPMPRRQKNPLRPLTDEERAVLLEVSRARSERADRVARARLVLAVAEGTPFTQAARSVGRRSGDAVAALVARFNTEGLAAIEPRHGGGPKPKYPAGERARILQEVQRVPDREQDGTATWSLTTLQRALRQADDGLPQVSTWTIFQVLHQAGWSWQRSRSWCATGTVERRRKEGIVPVTDPQTEEKKP